MSFRSPWSTALAVALAVAPPGAALANPQGPAVARGSASFARPDPATLEVTNSAGAVIDWRSFSIGAGELTRFIQPSAASAVLNRVTGPDPSVLLGRLTSNGQVILVNPSGLLVGAGAVIDTAGFIGSTLSLAEADFVAGRMRFLAGPDSGAIGNAGRIQARGAGSVYLVGTTVENSGLITTEGGDVVLAAGRSVTLSSLDLDAVSFEVRAGDRALNVGRLAAGGAAGLFAASVENRGVIEAGAVERGADGSIRLVARDTVRQGAEGRIAADGAAGGRVRIESLAGEARIEGTVSATGSRGPGGEVAVLGERVALLGAARIDVSGAAGGGRVRLGGGRRGAEPGVGNARQTWVGAQSSIRADATGPSGRGGEVVVWADGVTRAAGAISARGVEAGGFVEVSGKRRLDFSARVDAGASHGPAGTLLLDPTQIIVAAAGADALLADVDQFADPDQNALSSTSTIAPAIIAAATANVVLEATSNLGFVDPVTMTSPGVGLTGRSGGDVVVNAPITTQGGAVSLTANHPGGPATGNGRVVVNAAIDTTGGGLSGGAAITLASDGAPLGPSSPVIDIKAPLEAGSADLTLDASAGTLEVAGAVTAGTVTASGGLGVALLAPVTTTAVFNTTSGPPPVTLSVTSASGPIVQGPAGVITTQTLKTSSAAGTLLDAALNNADFLDAQNSTSGDIRLRNDSTDITVTPLRLELTGLANSAPGGAVVIDNSGSLGLAASVQVTSNDGPITITTSGGGQANLVGDLSSRIDAGSSPLAITADGRLEVPYLSAGTIALSSLTGDIWLADGLDAVKTGLPDSTFAIDVQASSAGAWIDHEENASSVSGGLRYRADGYIDLDAGDDDTTFDIAGDIAITSASSDIETGGSAELIGATVTLGAASGVDLDDNVTANSGAVSIDAGAGSVLIDQIDAAGAVTVTNNGTAAFHDIRIRGIDAGGLVKVTALGQGDIDFQIGSALVRSTRTGLAASVPAVELRAVNGRVRFAPSIAAPVSGAVRIEGRDGVEYADFSSPGSITAAGDVVLVSSAGPVGRWLLGGTLLAKALDVSGAAVTLAAQTDVDPGGDIVATSGTATVTASTGTATLAELSAPGGVSVSAPTLVDGNGAALNFGGDGALTLTVANGIGSASDPIETEAGSLDATVTTSGGIYIANTGDLVLGAVSTPSGDVVIGAASRITTSAPISAPAALELTATDGIEVLHDLTSAGAMTLDAGGGTLLLDGAKAETANGDIVARGAAITIAATSERARIDAGGGSSATTSSSATVTTSGGDLKLIGGAAASDPARIVADRDLTVDVAGDLLLTGGAGASSKAELKARSGTLRVTTSGAARLLGGSGDSAQAQLVGLSTLILDLGGDLDLLAGPGPHADADLETIGGGPMQVTVGGRLRMVGGTGSASAAEFDSQQQVTLRVAGDLIVQGGSGTDSKAEIEAWSSGEGIDLRVGGASTVAGGDGANAFGQIDAPGLLDLTFLGPLSVIGGAGSNAKAQVFSDGDDLAATVAGAALIQGGSNDSAQGEISAYGNLTLGIGGSLAMIGGTAGNVAPQNNADAVLEATSGALTLTVGGNLGLTGTGLDSEAQINADGDLTVKVPGGDLVVAGGASDGAFAEIESWNGFTDIDVGGPITVRGGAGSGSLAQLDGGTGIKVRAGGDVALLGGTGPGAFAEIETTAGNVVLATDGGPVALGLARPGTVTLRPGAGLDADAVLEAAGGAGTVRVAYGGRCTGCVPVLRSSGVTDVGIVAASIDLIELPSGRLADPLTAVVALDENHRAGPGERRWRARREKIRRERGDARRRPGKEERRRGRWLMCS